MVQLKRAQRLRLGLLGDDIAVCIASARAQCDHWLVVLHASSIRMLLKHVPQP